VRTTFPSRRPHLLLVPILLKRDRLPVELSKLARNILTCHILDKVTRAEIIWTLNCAYHDYSFSSNEDFGNTLRAMIPDSKIAENISLSSRKMSYLVSDGIGPYFQEDLVSDIRKSGFYTVSYDETTNAKKKEQLDVYIRYWSTTTDNVQDRYLTSFQLGHATGDILSSLILSSLDDNNISIKT
jgi:hypothetical protein